MNNVSEKNQEMQNNIQAKISFRKDMKTLRMNLSGINKNSKGYEYNYRSLDDIVREIKNVIDKHNLDLFFTQAPISVEGQYGIVDYIRTTFYSTSTVYKYSFDTRIHTDKLQWTNENSSKNGKTVPQMVGAAITYFRRCALVGYLRIKTDEFFDFNVYIKYKKTNIGNWIDLGTLDLIKEEYSIVTDLNVGGHTARLFSVKESEINNFVNSMIRGGAFNADYYGYQEGEDYKIKNIETKIETINDSQFITFLGRDNTYAILLEEFKMNLKRI